MHAHLYVNCLKSVVHEWLQVFKNMRVDIFEDLFHDQIYIVQCTWNLTKRYYNNKIYSVLCNNDIATSHSSLCHNKQSEVTHPLNGQYESMSTRHISYCTLSEFLRTLYFGFICVQGILLYWCEGWVSQSTVNSSGVVFSYEHYHGRKLPRNSPLNCSTIPKAMVGQLRDSIFSVWRNAKIYPRVNKYRWINFCNLCTPEYICLHKN